MPKDTKIAPRDLIQADFRNLRGTERLDTTPRVEELIYIQSMEGRAHNGAGSFHKRSYVNTTIDDIVKALGKDPGTIKERRQNLINEVIEFIDRVIAGENVDRLVTKKGTPLLGIPILKTRQINAKDVLKGIYMGGLRDTPEIRKAAEKKYKVNIGYGNCYLINIDVMDEMGLDGEMLAHQEHENNLYEFKKDGLIIEPQEACKLGEDKIRYFYIRHKMGPGQSDDAAIINAGFLYRSVDVALGVFLADAIDTLEKYAPVYKDQDSEIAYYVKEKYKDLGVTMDEVYRLAYLSAIPEGKEDEVPDSSLRYFLTIDPRTGQSTLECHLNFVEGKPFFPMTVSYKRILITTFYEYIKSRLSDILTPEEVMEITGGEDRFNVPIKDLIRKKVIVVSQDKTLSDVLKQLRDSDADAIIVQDADRNIVGIVDSEDFLYILERKH